MKGNLCIKSIEDMLLGILIFFFPLSVFWVAGRPLYIWIELLFIFACFLKYQRGFFINTPLINMIFISIALCTISSVFSDIAISYRKAAVVWLVYWIIMYFTFSYMTHMIHKKPKITLEVIIKAFKLVIVVELFWIPLQYVCYHFLSVDINDLIFVKTFHMVDNASFVRDWVWYPSGLTWHSAVLAPMFVLGLLVFKEFWIKVLIIADALICGNSTAIVGVLLTVFLLLLLKLSKRKTRVNMKSVIVTFAVVFVGVLFALHFGLFEKIQNQIQYTYMRIFAEGRDASTSAHLSYFTDYFKILKTSSFSQILFGYGDGCSGYPIGLMYQRYLDLESWAVECDPVNIVISRGLFGFGAYYAFLIFMAYKGFKIDKRYLIFVLVIIIEGLGYNVQWEYLFFLEMVLYLCIKQKINFFEVGLRT